MANNCARVLLLLVCCALGTAQGRLVGGVHEDGKLGFKIKVPDKWTAVPIGSTERWLVAKYICPRSYEGKLAMTMCKPELRIVHFAPAKLQASQALPSAGDRADAGRPDAFAAYKEWFKFNVRPGLAYAIVSDKPETLGEATFTRIETMTSNEGKNVIKYACAVYERKSDGSVFAVEFSQLDDYYKNLQGEFDKCFESFRLSEPATTPADAELFDAPLWTQDRAKWRELPKSDRWQVRQAVEAKRRARMLAQVPDGWITAEAKSKRFAALVHLDKKYATALLDRADATWDWLDRQFADVSDEYPLAGAIQLAKDLEEAIGHGARILPWEEYCTDDGELFDLKDVQAHLQRGLLARYLLGKDPYISFCPPWFMYGIATYLSTADVAGNKLVFKTEWEKPFLKEVTRAGAQMTLHQLISLSTEQFPTKPDAEQRVQAQLCALIRFLESKEGKACKGLDRFLSRYAVAVAKAGAQWRKDHPVVAKTKADNPTQAQLTEAARLEYKAFNEQQKFVLEAVRKEVVDLPQKDWLQIEAAWKKWLAR